EEMEELALAGDRQRRVNAALAQLPRDMAAAVRLVYFEEMTYAEAARVMGKKSKQVDNLLYRAKRELQSILGEEGMELL
ncbi:MAG: RNA polymerase subunit sigma-24, partial [Clostridiales bacterium]|nr:RNA polymerase subunit sigma-24 [Clostridiales bacterium]